MKKSAYLKRLEVDIARWVAGGLIDTELAGRLRDDAALHDTSDHSSPVLPGLAALAVMVGLLTIIAANWSSVNGIGRLGLLFGFFALLLLGAGELRARALALPSNWVATIGAVLFGGGLVVVGQLYHTSATTTAFLATWTIGATIIAVLLRAPSAATLAAGLGVFWTLNHMFGIADGGPPKETFFYGPFWVLPVWAAMGWIGVRERVLGVMHIIFIGLLVWWSPTIARLIAEWIGDWENGSLASLIYALSFAGFWAALAAIAEFFARVMGVWAARTAAGWLTWLASGALVTAAAIERFAPQFFTSLDVAIAALVIFSLLTAYGAAPGRRWLRGAGVVGFIATSLIFFTLADNLVLAGVILIIFGLSLTALLIVTNRMLRRARMTSLSQEGVAT